MVQHLLQAGGAGGGRGRKTAVGRHRALPPVASTTELQCARAAAFLHRRRRGEGGRADAFTVWARGATRLHPPRTCRAVTKKTSGRPAQRVGSDVIECWPAVAVTVRGQRVKCVEHAATSALWPLAWLFWRAECSQTFGLNSRSGCVVAQLRATEQRLRGSEQRGDHLLRRRSLYTVGVVICTPARTTDPKAGK